MTNGQFCIALGLLVLINAIVLPLFMSYQNRRFERLGNAIIERLQTVEVRLLSYNSDLKVAILFLTSEVAVLKHLLRDDLEKFVSEIDDSVKPPGGL